MTVRLTLAQAAEIRQMLAGLRGDVDETAARVSALETRAAGKAPDPR